LSNERTPYLCECEDEMCIEISRCERDPKRFVVEMGDHQPLTTR
jgi:hypothetical protein